MRIETLIVAHDSGGAEVVSAWAAAHPERQYAFLLGGPAVGVFGRKFPGVQPLAADQLDAAVAASQFVLTGTGWSSDLEKRAMACALDRGVPVAAYLDHWVNYRSRFELSGRLLKPDAVWVGDEFALDIARESLPGAALVLAPNQYFEEMRRLCEQAAATHPRGARAGIEILYVTEPTSAAAQRAHGDPLYWGYTEFEALKAFLGYLRDRVLDVSTMVIRLHPAEPAGKYDALLEKCRASFPIVAGSKLTLPEDCARADWVVGCDSMAMVIGLIAGKQVFSSLPKHAPPLSLPFPAIQRLFQ